jgi:membrane glycosyltransferase
MTKSLREKIGVIRTGQKGILMPIRSKNPKKIVKQVMHEFKKKSLHVGKSKKKVTSRRQAIAIALSLARKSKSKRKKRGK